MYARKPRSRNTFCGVLFEREGAFNLHLVTAWSELPMNRGSLKKSGQL